jgi:hypothetical protein
MGDKQSSKAPTRDFAAKVYARMAELERQDYEGRTAVFAEVFAPRLPHEQELFDQINQARARGVFSRRPALGETIYNLPRPFRLDPQQSPITQALCFFTTWKEDRHRCLSAASDATSVHPQYPGGQFVREVSSFFDRWATSGPLKFQSR